MVSKVSPNTNLFSNIFLSLEKRQYVKNNDLEYPVLYIILKNNISQSKELSDEELYIGTARFESLEMYLKAIWHIAERGNEVKVSSIAKLLNIKQPSVVSMLHKLDEDNFVEYSKESISIRITPKGEQIARHMIRNTRLLEILMKDSLRIDIDEEMVCGIEHHMKEVFTDALCTLLKHPVQCPHGHPIPPGKCCPV